MVRLWIVLVAAVIGFSLLAIDCKIWGEYSGSLSSMGTPTHISSIPLHIFFVNLKAWAKSDLVCDVSKELSAHNVG